MISNLVTVNDLNKEIIQWACKYLLSHGYTLKSDLPENVKNSPWSYVVRFATSDDYIYLQLKDACLKNFIPFESKTNLLEALEIAKILWLLYGALAQYRLMLACDEEGLISFQKCGKLSDSLKKLSLALFKYMPFE